MTLILAIILYSSGFFIPYANPVVYGILAELLVILLFYSSFVKTEYTKPVEKAGWFCGFTWSIFNLIIFTWFGQTCVINIAVGLFELIIFLFFFFYSQLRCYNINSDDYNENDCFLIYKKPSDLLGFFFSCLWSPISSVSVVSKGVRYGYRMSFPFQQREYIKNDRHILIKVNVTDTTVREAMEPMLNAEWTFKKNCCYVVQKLFPDIKFHKLRDRLPCYFINTILKNRGQ